MKSALYISTLRSASCTFNLFESDDSQALLENALKTVP